jgi:hypothetical protein
MQRDEELGWPGAADESPADDPVSAADESPGQSRVEPGAGTPQDPDTGNARVDEAVARLTELGTLPTAEHAAVYEDVHRRLHGALTELDSE